VIAPASVPAGVLSLVGDAARRQRDAERRCLDLLLAQGFGLVHLPVLEYAPEEARTGYRFVDPSGRVVAVRSDFTPVASRVLGRGLAGAALPLEVCYAGEVVRPQPVRLRALPELYQVGFESYGVEGGGVRALEVTLDLLRAAAVPARSCHLTVDVAALAARMLATALNREPDDEALELARVRDLAALADLAGGPGDGLAALEAALLGEPPPSWAPYFGAEGEVDRMAPMLEVAARRGISAGIDVAPRLTGGYYEGIVFTVWGRGTRAVLAAGGEYRVDLESGSIPAAGGCLSLGIALEEGR
jgi:ATP phosphoribosyltransferase regulatory subunit